MNSNTILELPNTEKSALAIQEKLDRLLAKAKPTKREQIQKHFRDLFPKLEEHLAQGRSLKEVLTAFNTLVNANVCVRTFNEMLAKEREQRDQVGNPICCNLCGRRLRPNVLNHRDSQEKNTPIPDNAISDVVDEE